MAGEAKREAVERLGFDRGSADKLSGRPFDDAPPNGARAHSRVYRSSYRRGYMETAALPGRDATGISFGFNANANVSTDSAPSGSTSTTSQPSTTDQPEGGFGSNVPVTLPPDRFVKPVMVSPTLATKQVKQQVQSPFAPPPQPQPIESSVAYPGATQELAQPPMQVQPTSLALPLGGQVPFSILARDWFSRNWGYVAVGAGVLVVAGVAVAISRKQDEDARAPLVPNQKPLPPFPKHP